MDQSFFVVDTMIVTSPIFTTTFHYYHAKRPVALLKLRQDEMGQRLVCFESQGSSGWHGEWSSYIREGGRIHLHVRFNCRGENHYQHNLHLYYQSVGWWVAFQLDDNTYNESEDRAYSGHNSPVAICECSSNDRQVSIITIAVIDIFNIFCYVYHYLLLSLVLSLCILSLLLSLLLVVLLLIGT